MTTEQAIAKVRAISAESIEGVLIEYRDLLFSFGATRVDVDAEVERRRCELEADINTQISEMRAWIERGGETLQ